MALVCALPHEWAVLARRLEDRRPVRNLSRAWTARFRDLRIVLFETGMGVELADARLGRLFDHVLPGSLLGFGFAGGLAPDLSTGEAIWASETIDAASGTVLATPSPLPPSAHAGRLERILTTMDVISSPDEKRALHERHHAAAVDTESAAWLRAASRASVPARVVRAIVDPVDECLPAEIVRASGPHGQVSAVRLGWSLLRRPALAGTLARLGRQSRGAARTLADVVEATLTDGGWR